MTVAILLANEVTDNEKCNGREKIQAEKIVFKLMLFYERKMNDRTLISSAFMLGYFFHIILFYL